jgi:iron complex outermembrane receptor protein
MNRTSRHRIALSALACACATAFAQEAETIVVTATREARNPFDVPAAIDSLGGDALRADNLRANLSEALGRVPGLVVANRQNYAQDLQVSSRGFGGRATFGTRGLRIITDGIPATSPDGQGQTSSIDLDSAQRIEVLRGPLSVLYGNSAGGVIQVFSEDGRDPPAVDFTATGGSFGTHREALGVSGVSDALSYRVNASRFATDGYRDHSAAVREQLNAKLATDLGPGRLTVVAGGLHQADTQDPLGLTRAQFESNPQQADPVASTFDTRKSIRHNQAGAVYEAGLPGDALLTARVYAGDRQVTQYLGLTGSGPLSSGGVVDLDRGFQGAGLRWSKSLKLAGMATRIAGGLEYDRQDETRRGYVNNFGSQGDLRRDEDDVVDNSDAYVQGEIELAPQWSLTAGARYSHVHFKSTDHYIVGANPDDSGSITYVRTLPVAAVVYHASDDLRFHASVGGGFETPTFAELAYRPGGATGLNLGLKPSRSTQFELGSKARLPGGGEFAATLFQVDTRDEIVVNSSVGGRTDYKNASKTRRRGAEVSADHSFGSLETRIALTFLDAQFREGFASGIPPQLVPAGNKLPGVPRSTAYGEAIWHTPWLGMHVAAEVRYAARIFVNDANSDSAPAATVANVRVGWEQKIGRVQFKEFVRVDNITDRAYAGSVIVAESNGRYFEPAPGRNYLVGISASVPF